MKHLAPMDTGVHKEGNGYERTILFAEPGLPLLKFELRVDRIPELSYAEIGTWNPEHQVWELFERFGASRFWHDVPGWERFSSDRTDRSTYRLALELVQLVRVAYAEAV